ncbi:hypothetical protein [Thalassobacillus hwangdonensis]|uniref:Uncharacterized protein n=1 Tax=Thalassobacillus hwangdonensis TaxID=546108 RepID=A0ABW3L4C0_9BACI
MNFQPTQKNEAVSQWKPMIGFVLCIVLTAFTLWVAFYSEYSPKTLLVGIAVLAFSQAVIQLVQLKQLTDQT